VAKELTNELIWKSDQGCQMVHFHTKNPNVSIFYHGLGMENVGVSFGHLETIPVIW
jgi:hypothetical protein